MTKKYKAAVFDFDLTLADSSKGIIICFKHTLSHFGYLVPDDETIYNTIGMTLEDAFDVLTGIKNNPDRSAMRKEYVKKADEEMVKNTIFYDGIIEGLKSLKKAGIKVGICSTKYRYRIEDSFRRQAGCLPVDVIIGGEDVKNHKPDPSGLLSCIESLAIDKSDVLYVGDNIIDAMTAHNASVDFGAALTGSSTAEDFKSYPFVIVENSAAELIKNVYEM